MFRRSTSSSLKLQVGDAVHEFLSPDDFAFALSGRAGVPGSRITSLAGMASDALRREAEAIRRVEQKFNDTLDGVVRDVTRIGPFLREIDLTLISQDHAWRNIVGALMALDDTYEAYKKVALVKYVQYLAARRLAVTTIYSEREHGRQPKGQGQEHDHEHKIRETAIFEATEVAGPKSDGFVRMPKGETVDVDIESEGRVSVLLARHECRIESNGRPQFVDDNEVTTPLRSGKNIVGRDMGCDVLVNAAYRDISRRHLIIEVHGGSRVRLTDISSHGTSLSPRLLESTSI
jgi:hypothetical protein